MRHSLPVIALAAALGGCATVPHEIAGDNFAAVTPEQAVSQNAAGQRVRWGGEIINVEPRADATCFEVLSRELYSDARPSNHHDHSDGRFVATRMTPEPRWTVHMPDLSWTARAVTCDPAVMSVTDPLLVVRRHVDFLRVRSAICRDTR